MINLANCYEFQQRFEQAIKWYKYALEVDPIKYEACLGLALCYFKNGNPEDSLKSTERGVEILKTLRDKTKENDLAYI